MKEPASKAFLDRVLEGLEPSPKDLDNLLGQQRKEDLYLDYKSGQIFENPKTASKTLRQYVSAFANAEGGVLIIGVHEPDNKEEPLTVDGATAPGGQSLHDWAARVLRDLTPYFSFLPRLQMVSYPKSQVLVVAVDRSAQLVPCVESGKLNYYLRIGDSTVSAPDYLISDLVLGRRQQPVLELAAEDFTVTYKKETKVEGGNVRLSVVHFAFRLENLSLVDAHAVDVGVVTWSVNSIESANNHLLLRYVDFETPAEASTLRRGITLSRVLTRNVLSRKFVKPDIPAFGSAQVSNFMPAKYLQNPSTVACAVFVRPRDAAPSWYSLKFQLLGPSLDEEIDSTSIEIKRVVKNRPLVGIMPFKWSQS